MRSRRIRNRCPTVNYIRNGTKMNNLRTREVEIKEKRDFPWVKIKKKKKRMVETKEVRW